MNPCHGACADAHAQTVPYGVHAEPVLSTPPVVSIHNMDAVMHATDVACLQVSVLLVCAREHAGIVYHGVMDNGSDRKSRFGI